MFSQPCSQRSTSTHGCSLRPLGPPMGYYMPQQVEVKRCCTAEMAGHVPYNKSDKAKPLQKSQTTSCSKSSEIDTIVLIGSHNASGGLGMLARCPWSKQRRRDMCPLLPQPTIGHILGYISTLEASDRPIGACWGVPYPTVACWVVSVLPWVVEGSAACFYMQNQFWRPLTHLKWVVEWSKLNYF